MKYALAIIAVIIAGNLKAQKNDFPHANFARADSIAFAHANESLGDPKKLALNLTSHLSTEQEKFRAIFRWVTDNISYDYKLYQRIKRIERKYRYNKKELSKWNRRWNRTIDRQLVNKKSTICSGYSRLINTLTDHAGILSTAVYGFGRTTEYPIGRGSMNHSWNVVKINSKWYLCDATWASGGVDRTTGKFIKSYSDHYFLTDPSLFIANHFPADTSWMLLSNKPTYKQFVNAPLKSTAFISNQVNQYFPPKGLIKTQASKPVEFGLTFNNHTGQRPYIWIPETKHKDEQIIFMSRQPDGMYVAEHRFPRRGAYRALVVINNYVSLTYNVSVR